MKLGVRILVFAFVMLILGFTARLWLPPLMQFLEINSEIIQALEAGIQLLILTGGVVLGFFGWRKLKEEGGGIYITGDIHPGDGDIIGRDKKVEGGPGSINIGRDLVLRLENDEAVKALAQELVEKQGRKKEGDSTQELKEAEKEYLSFMLFRYRYLSFKGMGAADKVPLNMPLIDLYVPLRARRELPEHETWVRNEKIVAELAGREMVDEERQPIRLSKPEPVLKLLQENKGLILLGDPGAGKSTFLKFLALVAALGQGEPAGLDGRLPVLVALSGYANALREKDISLENYIVRRFEEQVGNRIAIAALLRDALQRGRALVLLDGLDEVWDTTLRHKVVNRVENFYALYCQKENKFLITSRVVGYKQTRISGERLVEATLVDFGDQEIALFVQKWTDVLERLAQEHAGLAQAAAENERRELLTAIQQNRGVRRLAANPLLLTILCIMKRQDVSLPRRRVQLYDRYVRVMLSSWNRARGLDGPAPGLDVDEVQTIRLLAPLALWMHVSSAGAGLVKREDLRRKLVELYRERAEADPEAAANRFLHDVHEHTCLLLERGAGEYGYIHLTFEEYLAGVGVALLGQGSSQRIADSIGNHVGEQPWREVSLLAVGYVGIIQQLDRIAGEIVEALVDKKPGPLGEAEVLAGEAVLDAWPGGVPQRSKEKVEDGLRRAMQDAKTPPKLRWRSGLVLGRLSWQPGDLDEYVEIPPGTFWFGDEKPEENEIPYRYWIGKYPVTNAQFARFVQAKGYQEERYWSAEGRKWLQIKRRREEPFYFRDYAFGNPIFPVVGVTWFEAQAYCGWLDEVLKQYGIRVKDNLIPVEAGYGVCLPTELEWERAARGVDGREYPWEGGFKVEKANTNKSKINSTTAVCTYPQGVSPSGVWDMSGNVWEWTASRYYQEKQSRVVRGGSWHRYGRFARCAYRLRLAPEYYYVDDLGFRVVLSPDFPLRPAGAKKGLNSES